CVPEAVDRLELVADRKELGQLCVRHEVDELALEAVRVLELVDHHHPEAQLQRLPRRRVVAEDVARGELEILEVDDRLATFGRGVLVREQLEELLEQVSIVSRELLERGSLGSLARELERRRARSPRGE